MRVLLPVDGSIHSDAAVQSVVELPWPEGATFHVMTVAEPFHRLVDGLMGPLGQTAAKAQQMLDDDIRKVLAEASDKLRARFGTDKVSDQFVEGVVSDQILAKAKGWKADLIVIGAHGTGGYNDEALGSICMRVVAHAPCSVRIVNDLTSPSLEGKLEAKEPLVLSRILLPINDSANAKAAVDTVLNKPWPSDAKVQILVVVSEGKKSTRSRFFKAPEILQGVEKLRETQKAEAEKFAKGVSDRLEQKFGKGNVSYHVLSGSVRSLILQIAQDWPADLIVMGAHDQDKSVLETLLGSVARAVVSEADCSLELVRKL